MSFENSINGEQRRGLIEVITGSMFSGKTEELIRRLKRAKIFKPIVDNRYSETAVISHDENAIQSTPVSDSVKILDLASDVQVVGIDEAQFFDEGLVDVCNKLADRGIRVIVAGLDMDYKGRPFGPVPGLMAIAEYITKVHAICQRCGDLAQYSFRKSKDEELVLLGELDEYEPLCRKCYIRANKGRINKVL